MFLVEEIRNIRIRTLEDNTGIWVEKWAEDWKDSADDEVTIVNQSEVTVGEIAFTPIKWKCPDCGRWNYELTPMDNSTALTGCQHCNGLGEF